MHTHARHGIREGGRRPLPRSLSLRPRPSVSLNSLRSISVRCLENTVRKAEKRDSHLRPQASQLWGNLLCEQMGYFEDSGSLQERGRGSGSSARGKVLIPCRTQQMGGRVKPEMTCSHEKLSSPFHFVLLCPHQAITVFKQKYTRVRSQCHVERWLTSPK